MLFWIVVAVLLSVTAAPTPSYNGTLDQIAVGTVPASRFEENACVVGVTSRTPMFASIGSVSASAPHALIWKAMRPLGGVTRVVTESSGVGLECMNSRLGYSDSVAPMISFDWRSCVHRFVPLSNTEQWTEIVPGPYRLPFHAGSGTIEQTNIS